MPTSYSTLLGLALPVTGELSGTWGDEVNNYITQYLDSAVAGVQTISGSQTAVTLSRTTNAALSQAGSGSTGSSQYQIINCTGNPASALTITVPSTSKVYVVLNNTSTNQTVTVKPSAAAGVTVAAARAALIAWNGTDFELVATDDASKISGILAVANGGTGLSSGTSGGVPYFSGSTTMASSAALAANALVVGGGAGAAPSTVTTGTGVVTALGVNTGSAGAFVVNGGALGTPSSGTVTNLTGTASININGTVGATTPSTGSFTTLTTSSTVTVNGGTVNTIPYLNATKVLTSGSALQFDGSNLGINIAPNVWTSGIRALQIASQGSIWSGSNGISLSDNEYVFTGNATRYIATGPASSVSLGSGAVYFLTAPSGTANTSLTWTTRGFFDSSGLTVGNGSINVRAASTQDGVELLGRAGGTSSFKVSITPTTLTASRTLTAPDVTGTIITTGDTSTVTNTMLAGSIANNKLANSTISGVALGSNLNTLTLNTSGTGLSGSTTYNGSGAATFTVTSNATSANTASAIVARDASGNFSAGTITATLSGNATNVSGTVAVANGGTGATTAPNARTNLGATTVGSNLFTLTNPSAVTFPRFNADNTVSALDAATFRSAIGAGSGSGTVTSVSGTGTVQGLTLSGSVTSSGSLTLGGSLSAVSLTTQVSGTLPVANGGTGVTTSTGSGNNVLSTSPTLVTPILGTPTSGTLSNCTVDGTNAVGYRNLPPVGTKTASYTLATGDVGKYVQLGTSGAIVIPTSTFAEGDAITLFNNTTGNITITCSAPTAYIAGTNTVKTSMTLATRGVATVLFISSTLCVVTGNVT